MNLKCKYEFDDLVEYDPPTAQESGYAYGFIRSVNFRKTDAVNYIAEYSIERCNSDRIDGEVRETEIRAVFKKDTVTPL